MADDRVFIADCISKRRFRGGKAQYHVKWKGCPSSYNTWEPEGNILDPGLILEFEARLTEASSKGRKPGRKPKLLKLKVADCRGRSRAPRIWQSHTENREKTVPDIDHKKTEKEPSCDAVRKFNQSPVPISLHLNSNLLTEYSSREDKWKIPRKPKSLFLEQSIRDSTTSSEESPVSVNPSLFSAFNPIDSPLVGMVPSPTFEQNCDQLDSAKTNHSDIITPVLCDVIVENLEVNGNSIQANIMTKINKKNISVTDGNSVKLGKFALLRKYRNSLEESDPVTTTDVTVEGVTVTVRESGSPRGFFGSTGPKLCVFDL